MPRTTSTRPAGRALLAAGALAGAGLALVPTTATADEAPALTWEISPRFDDHLSTHVLGGGASESEDGAVTFPDGVASAGADGSLTMSYQGSVSGSFAMAGTAFYTVTLADPQLVVGPAGEGSISAVVSASNAATGQAPAAETTPARVPVVDFEVPEDWEAADGLADVVPAWDGVLPAGSPEATALGIPEDRPVEGRSFTAEFLGQLTPGVRAHFYASGAASDATKQPSPFGAGTVAAAAPRVSVTTVAASHRDGLTLRVDGTGFNPATNPGDAGVYVGLAEAGELPDTGSMDTSAFAAVDWVTPARFTDGAWTSTLVAPTEKLDPATSYAVFTWQAHRHSNTTQDTQTPVTIDFTRLQPPTPAKATSRVVLKNPRTPTTRRAGKATVRVLTSGTAARATGRVSLVLKKGNRTVRTATRPARPTSAAWGLPKLARGAYKVVAVYRGSTTTTPARAVVRFRVIR
ncbi:hypothetical protein [Nocardioides nanhaiensis]|uniref:Htaa domain-containing protein n=1 Tax=Nocardioides nanhaiensis TaxID=1476871 RepID=A0ABP8WVF9_9ACTN